MIEPHSILTRAIATVPDVTGFKPNYKWGDELHLNQLIKLYNNQETREQNGFKNLYPLVYNVQNRYTVSDRGYVEYRPIQLVVATANPHTEYHNGNRWATSYQNVLLPTVEYLIQMFKKAGVFMWDGDYTLFEFPNYGNTKENETIDIWDALRFEAEINIMPDRCLGNFYYKTT